MGDSGANFNCPLDAKHSKPYTHFEALVLLFKMGMGFAMFGATVAEKFERIVEVGGRIARIASADASECSKVLPTHPE